MYINVYGSYRTPILNEQKQKNTIYLYIPNITKLYAYYYSKPLKISDSNTNAIFTTHFPNLLLIKGTATYNQV